MKKTLLLTLSLFVSLFTYSQSSGINTTTPQKTLHVNGSLQVVNELNVGGNASTAGSAGAVGETLISNGAGVAPSWKAVNTVSGSISTANYVQGTTAATIAQANTADVPGVTITLTVPAGKTQTFMFTILGYVTFQNGRTSQGVMTLLQNGTKISSAFISKAGIFPTSAQPSMGAPGTVNTSVTVNIPALSTNYNFPVSVPLPNYPSYSLDGLVNMPIPVTFLKSVTLGTGTYVFKVQYSAWAGSGTVNYVPSTYAGYNADTECMLTKMQVLVYNN